jgi:hypothetical protein
MEAVSNLVNLFGAALVRRSDEAKDILASAPEGAVDAVISRFRAGAAAIREMGLADRVKGLQADLGSDDYKLVASGPGLAAMLDDWVEDRKNKLAARAIADLVAVARESDPERPLSRECAAAYFGVILMADPAD